MTPFLDPHDISRNDRPARLRRDAELHRLARRTMSRTPRRRLGLFSAGSGNDAA